MDILRIRNWCSKDVYLKVISMLLITVAFTGCISYEKNHSSVINEPVENPQEINTVETGD